jgi:hypothetical protein
MVRTDLGMPTFPLHQISVWQPANEISDIAALDKRICIHGLWPHGLELYPRRYSMARTCVEIWILFCAP